MMQMDSQEMITMMKQAKNMDDAQIEQMVMMKAQEQGQTQQPQDQTARPGTRPFRGMVNDMAGSVRDMRRPPGGGMS